MVHGCPQIGRLEDTGEVQLDDGRDGDFQPDMVVHKGDVIKGPGWTLTALETPGHTSNHICYALAEENALFSGDHIMGWSTTVVAPPDGDMSDYMRSLALVRAGNFDTIWPTHGPPITDTAPFLDAYAAHRRERVDQILNALQAGPSRIRDLVPVLYADVDKGLHGAASRSMLAAILYLVDEGKLVTDGPPEFDSLYRLAA